MQVRSLLHRIKKDLKIIGLPSDEVDIYFRKFSKTFLGRYYSPLITNGRPKIYLYPYENRRRDMLSYDVILSSAIHEMVHHLQYSSPDFERCENVMHNPEFWILYNNYIDCAKEHGIIRKDFEVIT